MRPLILAILGSFACIGCGAKNEAAGRAPAPAPARLEPAPTPGEAFERATRAMAEGDDEAHRRIVIFRPPCLYVEAQARARLAGNRLHKAVREHGVSGRRVRDAGFDRNERLIVNEPPTRGQLEQGLKMFRDMGWKIDGSVATFATTRPLPGDMGETRAERVAGGWVMVVSEDSSFPNDDPYIRTLAASSSANADVLDEATAAVKSGKFRTIREVNDFIDKRRNQIARQAVDQIASAAPTGPVVIVTDAETGAPVRGAAVRARVVVPPGKYRPISATTDAEGRARLPAEPETIHDIQVAADGYARRDDRLKTVPATDGRPEEVHVTVGKPAIVEVTLVLPDERRAAVSVHEGDEGESADPGTRDQLDPRRIRVPVQWADDPPPLPDHQPLMILRFDSSPHRGKKGVVHRVRHAQTAAGRELPVFRDAPPQDPETFALYLIGRDGFGSTVFVIGTLNDARETEAKAPKFQWTRNDQVLGPRRQPVTSPTAGP